MALFNRAIYVLARFDKYLLMVHLSTTAQRLVQPTTWQAGVIWGVTTTNVIIGFIQESKAEEAIAALSKAVTTEATAIRNGANFGFPPVSRRNQTAYQK